jgi:hypothetical protein
LNYLTPADYLQGDAHVQHLRLRKRKSALADAAQRRRAYWKSNDPFRGLGNDPDQVAPSNLVANFRQQKVSF